MSLTQDATIKVSQEGEKLSMGLMEKQGVLLENRKKPYVEFARECELLPKELERALVIREVNEMWENVQQRKLKRTPACILSRGVMKVAHERVKEKRRNGTRGWLCGTYVSSKRRGLEQLLKYLFPEFAMELLIAYCRNIENGKTLDMKSCERICETMLSLLVALAPNLHLNPFSRDYLDVLEE